MEVKEKLLSCVRLFMTPWTPAYQAPLSMGFSRQEYWSGLPLPSPDDDLISDNFIYKMGLTVYNFTFTFHFHALKKEMATHSGILAWRIPGTGELPSMGSHRVGHD